MIMRTKLPGYEFLKLSSCHLFVACILLSSFLFISPKSMAQNLLTNPGFERDFEGYGHWGDVAASTIVNDAHWGTKAYGTLCEGWNHGTFIDTGAAPVTPGETYKVGIWMKAKVEGTTPTILWLYRDGGQDQRATDALTGAQLFVEGTSTEWTLYEASTVAPDGAISLVFMNTGEGEVAIDDAYVIPANQTFKAVTALELDNTSIILSKGATGSLIASITPSKATNQEVYWKSSDTSVATVDKDGNINAVNNGTATITAWVESITATSTVTVGTTGIFNNSSPVSKIYPNPVTGNSFIVDFSSFQSKLVNLSVFDICGKSVYKTQATNSIQLSRSQFNKGVYFVRLDDSSRTETIKMIVQ
jgi:hypothetical protein